MFQARGEPTELQMEQVAQRGCAGSVLGAPFSRPSCRKPWAAGSDPRAGPTTGRGWTIDLLRDPLTLYANFWTKSPHPACVIFPSHQKKKIILPRIKAANSQSSYYALQLFC